MMVMAGLLFLDGPWVFPGVAAKSVSVAQFIATACALDARTSKDAERS
jgi:hypothetical protein